jgi:hypothetical protein
MGICIIDLPCFAIDPIVLGLGFRPLVRHNGEPQMENSFYDRQRRKSSLEGACYHSKLSRVIQKNTIVLENIQENEWNLKMQIIF